MHAVAINKAVNNFLNILIYKINTLI